MYPALLLLMLAVSVKDTAMLRNGCGADDDTIVTLAPGEPLTIRYRLASEAGPCYKVVGAVGRESRGRISAGSGHRGARRFRKRSARRDLGGCDTSGRRHQSVIRADALAGVRPPLPPLRPTRRN